LLLSSFVSIVTLASPLSLSPLKITVFLLVEIP
jgi:hypothetical protein